MITRTAFYVVLALAAAVSCRPDDQRTDELDPTGGAQARENMPAEAVAQLDSGNTAMRTDDFEAAVTHYTRVTELAPDFGSGWFGLYMVESERGDPEAAADALERARSLAPGASLLRDTVPEEDR